MEAFETMMAAEEAFISKSPGKRRIMIDLYETNLTSDLLDKFSGHIERLSPKIIKLAISADKKTLNAVRKALNQSCSLGTGQMYFTPDMEEVKTWLVKKT